MITAAKLDVYCRHNGNIDRPGAAGSDIISNREWNEIDALRQELFMYKHQLVSQRYGRDILARLAAVAADPDTADRLMRMA